MRLPFHLSSDLVLGLLLSVAALVGYGWMARPPGSPEIKLAVRPAHSSGRSVTGDRIAAIEATAAPVDSPRTELSVPKITNVAPTVEVATSAPGNTLHANGQRVEVSGYQTAPYSPGVGLSLLISSDETPEHAESGTVFQSTDSSTSQAIPTNPPDAHPRRRGLTYEEELFRSKWGWAAFGQAQIATRESAADPGASELRQRPR